MSFRGQRVLVTGGLGFIGSNLSVRLAELGARVTIVDSSVPGCGANPHNIAPVIEQVRVIPLGICEAERFADELRQCDVVFNLAGEISHIHSMEQPERDLQINAVAQLQFLKVCGRVAPGIRVVYAGTRQIYGHARQLPVGEDHPVQPVDFNGVHKYAATMYHMLMTQQGTIDAVVLRLTNVYGPRMALSVPCQGFLSTFLRRLMRGEPLEVFGDGRQLRDPLFVDDAVDAFLQAARRPVASRTYNVGGPEALSIARIAETASEAAGAGPIQYRAFPESLKRIEIGDYCTDGSLIRRELGWQAKVRFEEGIRRTLAYYREEMPHYLDPKLSDPVCTMPEHNGVTRRLEFAVVGIGDD